MTQPDRMVTIPDRRRTPRKAGPDLEKFDKAWRLLRELREANEKAARLVIAYIARYLA